MTITPFQGWIIWHKDPEMRKKIEIQTHQHDGEWVYATPIFKTFDSAVHALMAAMDHEYAKKEFGITKWLQDQGWTIECVRVHSYKV